MEYRSSKEVLSLAGIMEAAVCMGELVRRQSHRYNVLLISKRDCTPNKTVALAHQCYAIVIMLAVIIPSLGGHSAAAQGSPQINYQILEETPRNKLIGSLVRDGNLGDIYSTEQLRNLKFRILGQQHNPFLEYLNLDETRGLLITSKVIDRDVICANQPVCEVLLDITVHSTASDTPVGPGSFHLLKVRILILDRNDNAPEFLESKVSLVIAESTVVGTSFSLPSAEDKDSGNNGIQKYQLLSNTDRFLLRTPRNAEGSMDLHLVLVAPLDREQVDLYSLSVMAEDGGEEPLRGFLSVEVFVEDSNDNNPKFDNSTYEVFIYESTPPHTTIIQLTATDPDLGQNGQVMYRFAPHTENQFGTLFGITNRTGEIYLKSKLDFEQSDVYYLNVMAQDMGQNSLPTYAKVKIKIHDENDHAPIIRVNILTGTNHSQVMESAEIGTFVVYMSVTDPDKGPYGEFTCSVSNQRFGLQQMYKEGHKTEYKIVTKATFDREDASRYYIRIKCRDRGRLESVERIIVDIVDENDHAPKFSQAEYRATIHENNDIGTVIFQVNATDRDAGKNAEIHYSIVPADRSMDSDLLYIEPRTGVIVVQKALDYEKHRQLRYYIIAMDQGDEQQSSTATFILDVLDANDELPKFGRKTYQLITYENRPAGTEVGTITAVDRDSDFVLFMDAGTEALNAFDLDSKSGKITTKMELDREARSEYSFKVVARDSQERRSIASVRILVNDENDNSPVIQYPVLNNKTVTVSGKAPLGHVFVAIKATDPDWGNNGALSYRITQGNEDEMFYVDPSTGFISVWKDLFKLKQSLFKLVILVSDQGNPVRNATADLHIVVNKSLAFVDSYRNSASIFEGSSLIIFIIAGVGGLILVILVFLIVICLRKRKARNKKSHVYNCRIEASKALKRTPSQTSNGSPGKKAWMSVNGHCPKEEKSRKEVTFNLDPEDICACEQNDCIPSSQSPSLWPSQVETSLLPPSPAKTHASGPLVGERQRSPSPSPMCSSSGSGRVPHIAHPGGRPSPMAEVDFQVHDMMHMYERDKDSSDTGSHTDSGRGASEEGDHNTHSPMDHRGLRLDHLHHQPARVALPPPGSSRLSPSDSKKETIL